MSPEAARVDYTESWRVCHQAAWCRGRRLFLYVDVEIASNYLTFMWCATLKILHEFAEEIVSNTVGTWSVEQYDDDGDG